LTRTARSIRETTGFLLARAGKAHRTSVGEALAEVGLHAGQEMVLSHLWEEDGLGHAGLADRLGVEPPTLTRMLHRMEKSGLVERRRVSEDARCSRVFLTQKGRELREPVERLWGRASERAFEDFSEDEERGFREMLLRVRANLSRG
jgi:DNA-binding MarR family transcriptional regulator